MEVEVCGEVWVPACYEGGEGEDVHFEGPRVAEGKWDSRVERRVRVSSFVGLVRDIFMSLW